MRSRRASRAHLLLTQTDRPIKLIADDVGIRDLAHFSRTMKQIYGVSTMQPRRGECVVSNGTYGATRIPDRVLAMTRKLLLYPKRYSTGSLESDIPERG